MIAEKTTKRQRTTVAEPIRSGELYRATTAMKRLGWGWRAWWAAERAGLRTVKFRGKTYVSGDAILAFFEYIEEAGSNGKPR